MGKMFPNIEIICTCPVKNEEWIIEFFCKCASRWADKIILLDQGSDDDTVKRAQATPEVIVLKNPSNRYNEAERQNILIDAARRQSSQQLLIIALDADEFLSPHFPSRKERTIIEKSKPGTVFRFCWLQIDSTKKKGFPVYDKPFAYLDDRSPHKPSEIHSIRVPVSDDTEWKDLPDSYIYHLQLVNEKRFFQKLVWYQAFEISVRRQDPVTTFRQYHAVTEMADKADVTIPDDVQTLIKNIPLTVEPIPWWYRETLGWMQSGNAKALLWADIWDIDWKQFTNDGESIPAQKFYHRMLIKWLRMTQLRRQFLVVRAVDKMLRMLFHRVMNNSQAL